MKFSIFQMSRRGGRSINEDRMGYCYTRKSGIFLLADGMGGHPQGEVAAQLALQTIVSLYQKAAQPEVADVAAFLHSAVLLAHRQILLYASEKGITDTPRTTVVVAMIQNGCASWIHCGDSRLYVVRQGALRARTRDHSLLEQRRAGGNQFDTRQPVNRNVLFTCLGSPALPVVDVDGPLVLQKGDRLMLCSDGLWGSQSDANIIDQLGHKPVHEAVADLVEQSLRVGGQRSDNVTCLALQWESADGAVSTQALTESDFVLSFEGDAGSLTLESLDVAAIEQSIAELNETLRRSTARQPSK